MKLRTAYTHRPSAVKEENSGKTRVEKVGYVPAKRRIEEMIACGARLNQARKEAYDTDKPDDDLPIDPTRKPGLDIAEAQALQASVSARLRAQRARQIEKDKVLADKPKGEALPEEKKGS